MEDLLLTVEPTSEGLKAYGHKIRELSILACTELENSLKFYNLSSNKNMKDYIKILDIIDLGKYEIRFIGYAEIFVSCPFKDCTMDNRL
jgi:hypothetical protein